MVMLRKRKMILALIHEVPKLMGRQCGKSETVIDNIMDELKFLYSQLGLYDMIIDYMRIDCTIKAGV